MKTAIKGVGLGVTLRSNTFLSTLMAAGVVVASVTPGYADITNTATVTGTAPGGTPGAVTDDSLEVAVPVVAAGRALTIDKTTAQTASVGSGSDITITDGGDTVIYRFTVTNTGNVTENNIVIAESIPTFGGEAGTGSFGPVSEVTGAGAGTGTAATLAPTQTVVFEVTYTLSSADVYNATAAPDPANSVVNTALANSDLYTMPPGGAATETTGIVPSPALEVLKAGVLDDTAGTSAGFAEVGETITYTYTVTNTGNVNISDVSISDAHEGITIVAPTIAGETITVTGPGATLNDLGADANDGVIDVLTPGSTATFTYVHTVTQTEVDDG